MTTIERLDFCRCFRALRECWPMTIQYAAVDMFFFLMLEEKTKGNIPKALQ